MKQTQNEPESSRQHMLTLIRCQHMLTAMEPFTGEGIAVLAQAREHAHRLGHRYIGAEHLLLAVTSGSQPAGAILRERSIEQRLSPSRNGSKLSSPSSAARRTFSTTQ